MHIQPPTQEAEAEGSWVQAHPGVYNSSSLKNN